MNTDHEVIETYFKKDYFGNARIHRWFDRLSEFNFVPKYRAGSETASVDALSRSLIADSPSSVLLVSNSDLEKQIIELHKALGHRKSIIEDLKQKNISITQDQLTVILNKCVNCLEMDPKYVKSNRYIETSCPGEILGLDLMVFQN